MPPRVKSTCSNKVIPSPIHIHPFKSIIILMMQTWMSIKSQFCLRIGVIDYFPKRQTLMKILWVCTQNSSTHVIRHVIVFSKLLLHAHLLPNIQELGILAFKFRSAFRDKLCFHISKEKNVFLLKCRKFKLEMIRIRNPIINNVTRTIVPKVSSRDEIKTLGFGIAMIALKVAQSRHASV